MTGFDSLEQAVRLVEAAVNPDTFAADIARLAEGQQILQRTIRLQHDQHQQLLGRYTALQQELTDLRQQLAEPETLQPS